MVGQEERRDQDTRVGLCVDRVGRRQPEGGGAQPSQVVEGLYDSMRQDEMLAIGSFSGYESVPLALQRRGSPAKSF